MMKMLISKSTFNLFKMTALFLASGIASQWALAFDYPEEGDFARGSKTWAENCARCHNMRNPTDLRDDQWITAVFHMRIRAGLTGQETRDILTFLQGSNTRIKSSKNTTPKTASIAAGETSGKGIYESNCMACHAENGQGALPGAPDFTDKNGRMAKSDSELLSNIINGFKTPGSVMAMPPRGGNSQLSDTELFAALKYIRENFAK